MKKIKKKRIQLLEYREVRSRQRRKKWRKKHIEGKLANRIVSQNRDELPMQFVIPEDFSMDNVENVLSFVNTTYKSWKETRYRTAWFDMDSVVKIDIFSICLLLSLLNKLVNKDVRCRGNLPKDEESSEIVKQSGFLSMMTSNILVPKDKMFDNQMYMVGKDKVNSDRISKSVKHCMKYLLGSESHYPPVFETMVEICANSVEHANGIRVDKNWLVSISKEKDCIRFILTDTGKGILGTLCKKKKELFNDLINFRTDVDVLKLVFEKGYISRTGDINRHLGLPEVYETYRSGFISNLFVLTNCVQLCFDGNSKKNNNEFRGVLISWTVSKKNIEIWKQSL